MGNIRTELELAREFGFYDDYIKCIRLTFGVYTVFIIVLFIYLYLYEPK